MCPLVRQKNISKNFLATLLCKLGREKLWIRFFQSNIVAAVFCREPTAGRTLAVDLRQQIRDEAPSERSEHMKEHPPQVLVLGKLHVRRDHRLPFLEEVRRHEQLFRFAHGVGLVVLPQTGLECWTVRGASGWKNGGRGEISYPLELQESLNLESFYEGSLTIT